MPLKPPKMAKAKVYSPAYARHKPALFAQEIPLKLGKIKKFDLIFAYQLHTGLNP